ncbi:hypothetical protein, partial [Escherichia coli]|uniref:hypothetical protein n=1 Tax=Escherichia coli TaxID=562 RepID=UPI002284C32D
MEYNGKALADVFDPKDPTKLVRKAGEQLAAFGDLRDDGNKQTRLLANSVSLIAGKAVGATGTGYLDVLAGYLSGTASNGGFYVQLPNPTGYNNYTGIVTLNNITASDAVQIDVRQGDALVAN